MGSTKFWLLFFLFPIYTSAQDTTASNKQLDLVNKIESITGSEINYKDTVIRLKSDLAKKNQTVTLLEAKLYDLDKKFILAKYGQPGQWVQYGSTQYTEFTSSQFIEEILLKQKDTYVFFALNESLLDFSIYSSVFEKLVNEWKKNQSLKFDLSGFSDTYGDDDISLKVSQDRAKNLCSFLMKTYQIPESAIVTSYFGEKGNNRFMNTELDFLNRCVRIRLL